MRVALMAVAAGTQMMSAPCVAIKNNPDVCAARDAATAATYTAPQVSSLPEPHVPTQQFNVGNPLPFAEYTTGNFAYRASGRLNRSYTPGSSR
jgi:hypothetical protein